MRGDAVACGAKRWHQGRGNSNAWNDIRFSFRVLPMAPAIPPASAMITSQMVGDVRAKSSEDASLMGEREK